MWSSCCSKLETNKSSDIWRMRAFTWILIERIFWKITNDFENRLFHHLWVKACTFYDYLLLGYILLVASHLVPRTFRTQVILYLLGHFVLHFGHFVPSNNHFVPRSFRTNFGHFVPSSIGCEMTIWLLIRTQVISYPFWSFCTHFGHFVPILVIWWMVGWMDWDMSLAIKSTSEQNFSVMSNFTSIHDVRVS